MTTENFEFVLGVIFLAEGALCLLCRAVADSTKLGRALKKAECHIALDHPVFGSLRISGMLLGIGAFSLVAGAALIIVAFTAYAGL